jgi:hypothetical protein
MAPRRRAPKAAVEAVISADPITFASLPLPLAQRIFLALPVDARGRACCVCRAWRDALADPALWTRLDLSDTCGVAPQQNCVALLLGAAARARGALYRLDASGTLHAFPETLLDVLDANAGSLRELHMQRLYPFDDELSLAATVEALVAAAPLLRVLEVGDMCCSWEEASRVMRAEPPFALLRLHAIEVQSDEGEPVGGMDRFGPFLTALADVTLQPTLSGVHLWFVDTAQPALMNALVDAALARRLPELWLEHFSPPAAAPLARLLTEGALTRLYFDWQDNVGGIDAPLFDAAGAALVAGALRVNTTLTSLAICFADLFSDGQAACTLLSALVGHSSLRELTVSGEHLPAADVAVVAAALAALVAANSPAPYSVNCSNNSLEDDGLAPIFEALVHNRHLHTLNVSANNNSDAFKRVLRALLANHTSLRVLMV